MDETLVKIREQIFNYLVFVSRVFLKNYQPEAFFRTKYDLSDQTYIDRIAFQLLEIKRKRISGQDARDNQVHIAESLKILLRRDVSVHDAALRISDKIAKNHASTKPT